ncbi:MAG: Peptidase, family S24 [uncultured bacterium]|nr:MAG: Peptidase, family S24 [uncultured bacterium]
MATLEDQEELTQDMTTFDKLCDNLNLLMAEAHISADELSRRIGIPASTIKKIRNRYNPNPTLTTLIPLANYFTVSLNQLVGLEPLPDSRRKGQYKQPIESIRNIPVISWHEAISWPNSKGKSHPTINTSYEYSKNAYALIVEEEDWENLSQGTALIIDPSIKPEHRDFAIAYKTGQPIPSLKQLLYDEGQAYLKPVVHGYNITSLSADHSLLGVVVEYKKQLKYGSAIEQTTEM